MTGRPTPGPWSLVAHSWRETSIYSENDTRICLLNLEDMDVTEDNQETLEPILDANARLIAAAPDLLEVLKDYPADTSGLSFTETVRVLMEWNQKRRTAIAKAEDKK